MDAELYRRLIQYMQRNHQVLTEHIGSPELHVNEKGIKDSQIYEQDMAWLRESDVLIAECTCPSLGVGYELAYAEKCGKPCHIFYNMEKTHLSAMLTGNPYFSIYPYSTEVEIYATLDQVLSL